MQEIKKQSIVIASILKPVDDTRMFEKMGMSLDATARWTVHIIGHGEIKKSDSIKFHSLGNFERISIARFFASWKVFWKLIRIKPKVVIINTHELLGTVALYRMFTGCRSIYDITENYYLNILHTDAVPKLFRSLVANWVRWKEWCASYFMHQFLLAEKSYENEIPFITGRFTIVENKCKLPEGYRRSPVRGKIRLLFTGTIDTSTGIFEAINIFKVLQKTVPEIELRIVGFCALKSVRKKIITEIQDLENISCLGLTHHVSHAQIMQEISEATAGLVYYPSSRHTRDRIPTKVYEYLAAGLPIVYDQSATWAYLIAEHPSGIRIDFHDVNGRAIIDQLLLKRQSPAEESAMWDSEELKFLSAIHS